MSLRKDLIEYVFEGHNDPFTRIQLQTGSGTSPNGVVTAAKGVFLLVDYVGNATNKDVYINTDGSSAWVQINDET